MAVDIASERLFVKKLAVIVDTPPVQSEADDDVFVNLNHLVGAVPKMAEAAGPVLTPHQLLSRFMDDTEPPPVEITFPLATLAALLLNSRLKFTLNV